MKKIFPILTLIACLLLIGCSKKEEKPETTKTPDNTTTQTAPPTTTPVPSKIETVPDANKSAEEQKNDSKEPENKLRDKSGAIRVSFPTGSDAITLNGKIQGFGTRVTYVIEVKKGQVLSGRVIATYPEKNPDANIRIGQIISPSGKADGPFGVKIMKPFEFTESGDWKLVLDEDEMYGKSWKGDYTLMIAIR